MERTPPAMTTITTSTPHPAVVALPPRAVRADEWHPYDSYHYRNFEGENREVVAGTMYGADVIVFGHGVQHDDGSVIDNGQTDPVFEPPSISMSTIDGDRQTDTGITLTSEAARRLADVLVMAADEVDRWSTR
jgi:hypothetical protein